MSFTVACGACATRLTITDSLFEKKIKGRNVSVACKNCGSEIKIDGTRPREEIDLGEGGSSPPDVVPSAPVEPAPAKPAPTAAAGGAELPAEALWAISFNDDDDRELTAVQVGEALKRGEIGDQNLVWREGMDDWKPLADVPELAKHLPATSVKRGRSKTMAEAPVSKQRVASEATAAEPAKPEPVKAAPPPPAPAAPKAPPSPPSPPSPSASRAVSSPFATDTPADAGERDVVSSVSTAALAGTAASVPKAIEAASTDAEMKDTLVSAPALGADVASSMGLAVAPAPAAPASGISLDDELALAAAGGFSSGLDKAKLKRYAPLGVLVLIVIVVIVLLSASDSTPGPASVDAAKPPPAEVTPPRDIRQAMEQDEPKTATQAADQPASGTDAPAGSDPLFGRDKPTPSDDSAAAADDTPTDDLVGAMKKGLKGAKQKKK